MENNKLSFIEKFIDIQSRMKVKKGKRNAFADFNYRSAEDILAKLKPILQEHGLIVLLNDEIKIFGTRTYVEAVATITNGKDSLSAKASAREPDEPKAKMDASQTTGSTSSYARKYALSGLLGLDDGKDSDTINNGKDAKSIEKNAENVAEKNKPAKKITQEQIEELMALGFDEERLQNMASYYKVASIKDVSFADAESTIKKQRGYKCN